MSEQILEQNKRKRWDSGEFQIPGHIGLIKKKLSKLKFESAPQFAMFIFNLWITFVSYEL